MPLEPTRIVKGHGAEDARIVIVTDYPSAEEWNSGKAGTGYVERLFKDLFRDAGYNYSKCYITPLYKREFHLPRAKNLQDKYVSEYEHEFLPDRYGAILAGEIADIKPNVVVACGEYALRYLTGRQHILKQRGSILPLSDAIRLDAISRASEIPKHIRVIPVIHPRDIVQKEIHSAYTNLDIARIVKYKDRTDIHKDDSILWICWTVAALSNWWAERGRNARFLTIDIETYNGFITCIGFSHDGKEAFSVPLLDRRMKVRDKALILQLLSRIFKSKVPKVNQHIFFDDWEMTNWGWQMNNIDGCTMWLAHSIYPELPRDLGFLTSIYTEIPYYKDEGHDFKPSDGYDTLYLYNAKDALTAWKIYEAQERDAKEANVWTFYRQRVWPLYNIYRKQAHRGITIDPVEQSLLLSKYSGMLSDRHHRLEKLVGRDINYNAPAKIAELVYEDLEYEKQFKVDRDTGKRSLTTGEETLEELILNHSMGEVCDEILWNILWCRKLFKIIKLIKVPYHLDGRMRSYPKISGTKSGRTSMSQTPDRVYFKNEKSHPLFKKNVSLGKITSHKLGLSFQTIGKHGFVIQAENDEEEDEFSSWDIQGVTVGKDIRKMYIPSTGYTLVEGDGGQAEARIVNVIAEDWATLAEMNRKDFKRNQHKVKDDVHTKTAMLVKQLMFEEITEDIRQDFGKKPQHAGNYDMGAARLALMAHLPIHEAQVILTRFHSIRPKVRENFHAGVRSVVTNKREMRTPHGRLRQFLAKLTSEYYKEAFSWFPQAVVSDHTKFSTIAPLDAKWCDGGSLAKAYFLSESHDSGTFEVRNDCVDDFCEDFIKFGETPIDFREGTFYRDIDLVIPVEMKKSDTNWYEMKEIKR